MLSQKMPSEVLILALALLFQLGIAWFNEDRAIGKEYGRDAAFTFINFLYKGAGVFILLYVIPNVVSAKPVEALSGPPGIGTPCGTIDTDLFSHFTQPPVFQYNRYSKVA